jgi:hypothetical protein
MSILEQMSDRERNLVRLLSGVAGAIIVILVPLLLSAWLDAKEQRNADLREAIEQVAAAKPRAEARKAALKLVAAKYANKTPPLSTLIDEKSKATGLSISGQTDAPPVAHGKLYTERASQITVEKTGLKALVLFLEQVESSGYPVAITQLEIIKRGGVDADSYRSTITITAYDRVEAPAASASASQGGKSK